MSAEETPQGTPQPPPAPQLKLEEVVPERIWTRQYLVRLAGATFSARTTYVKLPTGKLWIHSPGGPLEELKEDLAKIGGEVSFLIASGDFHHLFLPEWQLAYPDSKTYLCPGLEVKRTDLTFASILTDEPEEEWKSEFEQLVIRGRSMSEVLFLHKASKTLLVTDLVEFITDDAMKKDGTDQGWGTWFWVNVLRMKNRAVMAPEYRVMGFTDKEGVKVKLEKVITEWCPEKVVVSHGENMDQGAESIAKILRSCWSAILGAQTSAPAAESLENPPESSENPPVATAT